jgi:hypothetical protein
MPNEKACIGISEQESDDRHDHQENQSCRLTVPERNERAGNKGHTTQTNSNDGEPTEEPAGVAVAEGSVVDPEDSKGVKTAKRAQNKHQPAKHRFANMW